MTINNEQLITLAPDELLQEEDLFPEITSGGIVDIPDILAYCDKMKEDLGLAEMELNRIVLETSHGNTTDMFLINVCLKQQEQLNQAFSLIDYINQQLDNFNFI